MAIFLLNNSVSTKHLTTWTVQTSAPLQTFCQAMNLCLFEASMNLTRFSVQLNLFIYFLRDHLLYLINSTHSSFSPTHMFCQFCCIKINCIQEIIYILIWSNPKDAVIYFILDNSITGEVGRQIFSTSAWQRAYQYHFTNAHGQVYRKSLHLCSAGELQGPPLLSYRPVQEWAGSDLHRYAREHFLLLQLDPLLRVKSCFLYYCLKNRY